MHSSEIIFFAVFIIIIILIIFFDLKVVGRGSHVISFKEALIWSSVWITLALGFYVFLVFKGDLIHGLQHIESDSELRLFLSQNHPHLSIPENPGRIKLLDIYNKNLGLEYITGYLIEYSLSIDNVFVMIMIFMAFGVEQRYYKKVLFWGILGAIIMRFIFIFLSAALIQRFYWVMYIFGAFLIFTGLKMFVNRNKEKRVDTSNHPIVKLVSRYFSVYPDFSGDRFIVKKDGIKYITPLLIVLLVIEFSDVIFAIDSVPAIFSVTTDPFIVFFSNIFAILGLRSLFFLLMNVMTKFRYLKHGLSILLTFIGVKMLAHHWLEEIGFTTSHSLIVILGIIGVSIMASLLNPVKEKQLNKL